MALNATGPKSVEVEGGEVVDSGSSGLTGPVKCELAFEYAEKRLFVLRSIGFSGTPHLL